MFKLTILGFALVVCGATFAPAPAQAAEAEAVEMPEHIRAKMARYRTKRFEGESSKDFMERRNGATGGCGGVNVGNVTKGRGVGSMPREVTVIVTGDVINANNKCN